MPEPTQEEMALLARERGWVPCQVCMTGNWHADGRLSMCMPLDEVYAWLKAQEVKRG